MPQLFPTFLSGLSFMVPTVRACSRSGTACPSSRTGQGSGAGRGRRCPRNGSIGERPHTAAPSGPEPNPTGFEIESALAARKTNMTATKRYTDSSLCRGERPHQWPTTIDPSARRGLAQIESVVHVIPGARRATRNHCRHAPRRRPDRQISPIKSGPQLIVTAQDRNCGRMLIGLPLSATGCSYLGNLGSKI